MEAQPDPEGELILRAATGDPGAFASLVDRTRDGLCRYLRTLVASDEVAEDALQETFLGAYRAAGTYRAEAPGRVWLYGLARRQAARTWRRRRGEPRALEPLTALGREAGFATERSPEALAAALEDRERLWAALEALSDTDREVVVLRDLDGFSGPEVAELLELPLPTMKTRLHRARLRLMAALQGGPDGRS